MSQPQALNGHPSCWGTTLLSQQTPHRGGTGKLLSTPTAQLAFILLPGCQQGSTSQEVRLVHLAKVE